MECYYLTGVNLNNKRRREGGREGRGMYQNFVHCNALQISTPKISATNISAPCISAPNFSALKINFVTMH